MKVFRFLIGLIATCCLASTAGAASSSVYGNLPAFEEVAVSPLGDRLATVRTVENARVVAISALSGGQVLGILRVGEAKLRAITWLDDDHVLISTSVTGVPSGMTGPSGEWIQSQVYDVNTKVSRPLPELAPMHIVGAPAQQLFMINATYGRPVIRHIGRDTVLFLAVPQARVNEPSLLSIYRFNITLGTQERVYTGSIDLSNWAIDQTGNLVATVEYSNINAQWTLNLHKADRQSVLLRAKSAYSRPELIGFDQAMTSFLVSTYGLGAGAWVPYSLSDGTRGDPIDPKLTFDLPLRERLTDRVIGGVSNGAERSYHFSDAAMQTKWLEVVKAFPGDRLALASYSDDFNKLVVRIDGPKDGYNFQLVDLVSMKVVAIGDIYTDIKQSLATQVVDYKATDGKDVQAFLTLPSNVPIAALPLVVLPHGGPGIQDTADFDWWSQALAAAGYAVLRPNYRGSTTSLAWSQAGIGEWGKKMQTDLSDGVHDLAAKGIIDPSRVCIVGDSYGGYAALAGVTLDPPGLYRCAVSVSGPSDLKAMLSWINSRAGNQANAAQRYWDQEMGVSGPNDPKLSEISPIDHVAAIQVPVLLIHGKDDVVVPVTQSEDFYDAMRSAGKNVQIIKLSGEDHWLSRSETRQRMLQATIDFLKKNNPPSPAGS